MNYLNILYGRFLRREIIIYYVMDYDVEFIFFEIF